MSYFDEIKLAEFWKSSDYARREYVLPSPTKNMIERVQDRLGYSLPDAYIELMRFQNGGLPKNTCLPTNTPTSWAANHIAIHGIMGIGATKTYSLCGELGSQFMIAEWGYPSIGIYFGDCPSAGHDMICLDYRTCGPMGEPRVAYVDQEDDYKITHLADNFELFICGLVDDAQFNEVDNECATEFIWRTDFMTASIQSYDCGQYLDLKQKNLTRRCGLDQQETKTPKTLERPKRFLE
ncbi:MAG: SMI1/KNR4 family protein [Ascidiaceihabitans sp.]|nr:SMI1/KNR4 family protein [Ascidiaceihabitans sp.]